METEDDAIPPSVHGGNLLQDIHTRILSPHLDNVMSDMIILMIYRVASSR